MPTQVHVVFQSHAITTSSDPSASLQSTALIGEARNFRLSILALTGPPRFSPRSCFNPLTAFLPNAISSWAFQSARGPTLSSRRKVSILVSRLRMESEISILGPLRSCPDHFSIRALAPLKNFG